MSQEWTETRKYFHEDDCSQSGCPGHELGLRISHTTGLIAIAIDGKELHWYEPKELSIISELFQKWLEE